MAAEARGQESGETLGDALAPAEERTDATKRERPVLSREEYGSIFYGSLFVVLAVGCWIIVGW